MCKIRLTDEIRIWKAKESAIQTALRRGDTNSVEYIEKSIPIKVYKPELVKRNPQQEHGNENGF